MRRMIRLVAASLLLWNGVPRAAWAVEGPEASERLQPQPLSDGVFAPLDPDPNALGSPLDASGVGATPPAAMKVLFAPALAAHHFGIQTPLPGRAALHVLSRQQRVSAISKNLPPARVAKVLAPVVASGQALREGLARPGSDLAAAGRQSGEGFDYAEPADAALPVESVLGDQAGIEQGRLNRVSSSKARTVRGRIFAADGTVRSEMRGVAGYKLYADKYTSSYMLQAFIEVSDVLGKKEFASLGWGKAFMGTTSEYAEVRGRVLDEAGRARQGMLGPAGYIAYADAHMVHRMDKAFKTVSAVLSEAEFASLGWGKQFIGTTSEYQRYRALIVLPHGGFNPEALWEEGLDNSARGFMSRSGNKSKDGASYSKARRNLRAVVSEDEIAALGWRKGK